MLHVLKLVVLQSKYMCTYHLVRVECIVGLQSILIELQARITPVSEYYSNLPCFYQAIRSNVEIAIGANHMIHGVGICYNKLATQVLLTTLNLDIKS